MAAATAHLITARVVPGAASRTPVRLRRTHRATKWLTGAAVVALAGALVFIGGATGTAEPAHAWEIACPFKNKDDAAKESVSEMYRSGVDSLTPAISPLTGKLEQAVDANRVDAVVSKKMTAYEYYGTSGATWSAANDNCWGVGPLMGNMMANQMFSVTKAITTLSISMYQWASSPSLLADFAKPMDDVVKGLKKNLYLNFLSPIIVLGALWMAWQGLVKKRTTEAYQGAIWMICSAAFALVFMAWPSLIATQANNIVSTVNSTAMIAVTGATSNAISEKDICYLSASGRTSERAATTASTQKAVSSAGVRMASCSIYKALVYTPWASGQFGVSPATGLSAGKGTGGDYARVTIPGHATVTDLRLAQLEAQAINATETNKISSQTGEARKKAYEDVVKADTDRWKKIQERAGTETWGTTWAGQNVGTRLNVGFASMIGAFCAGALVLVISFASIVFALGMLMLIMVAPLFLLIGAHPGFGRGIALKWLELLLGTVVKRIVLGFLLAILIGFYQVILATPMAWFSQVAMIVAVGVGALMYRKPLLETMNIVNLGGSKSGLEQNDFGRHAKKGAAGAIGMAAGGATAARTGFLNGGAKGALSGALGGTLSGGLMGARSGNPMRAAQMGSGAGRRAAGRQEASRDKKARNDDPFAYDAAEKKEAKQAAHLQSMADQYPDDPEMQRRLEHWAKKNDRPVPRPGAGKPAGDGSAPSVPRPEQAGGGGAAPTAGSDEHRQGGGAPTAASPRPGGGGGDSLTEMAQDVAATRRDVSSLERSQTEQSGTLDDLSIQNAKSSANNQDLAARTLARVKEQAERNGHKPTPPSGGAR